MYVTYIVEDYPAGVACLLMVVESFKWNVDIKKAKFIEFIFLKLFPNKVGDLE